MKEVGIIIEVFDNNIKGRNFNLIINGIEKGYFSRSGLMKRIDKEIELN